MSGDLRHYASLLGDIRARVREAQARATRAANRELVGLYWEIGRLIDARQRAEGWGAAVIPRLARDLRSELTDVRGFSERNLKRMIRFYRAYPDLLPPEVPQAVAPASAGTADGAAEPVPKVPQPVAQMPRDAAEALLSLPWGHHFLLLERVPDHAARGWYVQQALAEGWSRNVLGLMIGSEAHLRQGPGVHNFDATLPAPDSDLARQALKDPYVFDFLTLERPFRERELEQGLVDHLERFLLELGVGFAFVGRQHHLRVGDDDDVYLDLLFYHLRLRRFVVIELKAGPFQAEHAGKMNLYLNLVDDQLRHPSDEPSIGLILCQDKKQVLAEYALRGLDKPIGVSEYELTRALPASLASSLPTIDELEAELSALGGDGDEPS